MLLRDAPGTVPNCSSQSPPSASSIMKQRMLGRSFLPWQVLPSCESSEVLFFPSSARLCPPLCCLRRPSMGLVACWLVFPAQGALANIFAFQTWSNQSATIFSFPPRRSASFSHTAPTQLVPAHVLHSLYTQLPLSLLYSQKIAIWKSSGRSRYCCS